LVNCKATRQRFFFFRLQLREKPNIAPPARTGLLSDLNLRIPVYSAGTLCHFISCVY